MKTTVYFNLKSQDDADRFVAFLTGTMAPAIVKAGGEDPHLYEATSDALSRYMLEVTFKDEAAAQAAMKFEEVEALTDPFMEFVQDVTLISYKQVC